MSTGGSGSGGGRGGERVGGIEATVSLDTTAFDAGNPRVEAGLRQLDAGMTRTSGSMKSMGNTVLFATNALQDFGAAGMRGVTNNIPQLVMALGGGAGLAGTIMLVGLAVEVAGPRLHELGVALGEMYGLFGSGATLTEAQAMAALGDKTKRTADEQKRLNDFKREQQQIEAMLGGRTKEQKAVEAGVQEVFTEGPAGDVLKGILRQRAEERAPLLSDTHIPRRMEEARAELDRANRILEGRASTDEQVLYRGNPGRDKARLEEELRTLSVQQDAARRKDAERIMLQAKADPSLLIKDIERRPELYPPGVLEGLKAQTPGGKASTLEADLEVESSRNYAAYMARVRASRTEAERVDLEENEANAEKYARDKIESRTRLTEGERGAATEETRRAEREMIRDEDERQGAHADRLNGLNRRLREAMAPEPRTSRVMDASQLWASIQSSVSNAPSSQEKRLMEIRDINKDIHDEIMKFNRPVKAGGR